MAAVFEKSDDRIDDLARFVRSLSEEQLAAIKPLLTKEDAVLIERAVAARDRLGWRADPLQFGVHLGELRDYRHTRYLAGKFADAVSGRSPRQIWNVPARHGKSRLASQVGPTWALDLKPTLKLILCSYGDALASENSIAVRNMLIAHDDLLDVTLRPDRRRGDRFVTDQGGGLIAAGVGSALTGFGGHGIVVDDPHKDWQAAHSEAQRLSVWNWYRSVVRTRLENHPDGTPGWIIVVQTRWHEDDLTGKLLAADEADSGDEWETICLPAIAETDDDPLGRKVGDALAPDLYDINALLARARALGSYLTAGMEQQHPSPEEGTDIMRAWWKYGVPPPAYDVACSSWDMKLKDKSGGDFVVGQAWGRTGPDYWCVDQLRGQYNFATTKAAIVLLWVRNPWLRTHVIENTGNGPEVMAELRRADKEYLLSDAVRGELGMTIDEAAHVQAIMRRGMTGIVPENPKGDKRARMRAQTPKIESGNVHLNENGAWVPGFVDEMTAFGADATHDDQVDACSQALKRLSNADASVSGPPTKQPIPKPKPGARATVRRAPAGRVTIPRAKAR
jgi:hypothetical protein